MRRILVTGGAGFIGSHLVRALVSESMDVMVLDDLSTGSASAVCAGAKLVKGSVLDRTILAELLAQVDGCVHLAAIASVARCNEEVAASHAVNITGFVNILDALVQNRRTDLALVYASSAAVYGSSQNLPLSEDAPVRPLSPYGVDKFGCELHASAIHEVTGAPSVGLRFFNVYGQGQDPRSPYSGVISLFADRLARGEPITVHGDGGQTRDFIHVSDVVAALRAALLAAPDGSRVFNVCTGRDTSIRALAEALGEAFGVTPDIRHGPARDGDIRYSVGNPAALARDLGVEARVALVDGLKTLSASVD